MALLVNGSFVENGGSSSGLIFDRLEITKPANKLDYILNNNLDTSGIQIAGFYKGNDTEYSRDVTSECVFNPPSGSPLPSKGTVPVTISCNDLANTCTTSYNVNVKLSVDRYGTLSGSYEPAYDVIGASTGNYAIFGGGNTEEGIDNGVTAYDSDLVATTATSFSQGLCDSATASIGQYALIAGGETDSGASTKVYTYNTSLVQGTTLSLSKSRYAVSGASNSNYAIFAGGYLNPNSFNTVEAYNAALVRSIPGTLGNAVSSPGAASVKNNMVIFAGGNNDSTSVDAYNASLVKFPVAQLEVGRSPEGASTNSYAIFAGGSIGASGSDVVDAYNNSLVRTTVTPLSEKRRLFGKASLNGYAIFAGGDGVGGYMNTSSTVDTYDDTLMRNTPTPLAAGRRYASGATVGDYAIFVGGLHNNNHSNATDVYYDYTKQEAV